MLYSYSMKGDMESGICISDNEPVNTVLSVIVALGLLISFLPQVYKIIKYKTSEGISPWFLMLGTLTATSVLFNIIILQFNVIKCCLVESGTTCFENTLGIIQLFILWFMCMLILALFMIYFPSHLKLAPYIRHIHFNTPPTEWSIEWRNSIIISIVVLIHFILTTVISVLLLVFYGHDDTNWTILWAELLGVASVILISILFVPQLYSTWKRKSVGALSIHMMVMQVPGSFIFVHTLSHRPGISWTTWIAFFVSGCLQGILLIMCICWHYRSKRLGHGPFYVSETDRLLDRDGRPLLPDENTKLITNKAHKRNPSSRSLRPSSSRGSSYSAGSAISSVNNDKNNTGYLSVKY